MNEIRRGLESVGLATLLNGNQCLVKRAFAESKDIIIITSYFPVCLNISQIHDSMRKTETKNIAETCFDTVKHFLSILH